MPRQEPRFELVRRKQRTVIEKLKAKSEKLHWHKCYEIDFVASGRGKHIFNGKEFDFQRGAIYLSRLTDYHEIHLTSPGFIHRITLPKVCMPEDFWRSMIKTKANLITQLSPSMAKYIENLFLLLESRPDFNSLEEKYIQQSLLNVIIMLFTYEVNTNPQDEYVPEKQKVFDVLLYLQDNFRRKLTLDIVSKEMQTNANYLNGIFKKYTGRTIYSEIKQFRLHYASRLAVETDMQIKEICQNCGYTDLSNFQRDFKKQYNLTPQEYREKKRSEAVSEGKEPTGEQYDPIENLKE